MCPPMLVPWLPLFALPVHQLLLPFLLLRRITKIRGLGGERYVNPTYSVRHQAEEKISAEETVICHSKPASLSSTESSDGGKEQVYRIDTLGSVPTIGSMYSL
ncbi:Breast carcinoma amplified sequence [Quillaja saponaria]|uniref:Breast carcinoma amplified sequence n=1 Tax=Quillaja saponaria TaxID=32244 RepID=A0AAD7VJ51_QUISA|nr:Breast carcinoma amplified sequence [Quillaja saponaria]